MASLMDSVMQVAEDLTAVSVSSTSAQSGAVSGSSGPFVIVRLVSTSKCHVAFGANPTATTANTPLVADVPEYFKMNNGDKIAAIRASSDGTLNISRMV